MKAVSSLALSLACLSFTHAQDDGDRPDPIQIFQADASGDYDEIRLDVYCETSDASPFLHQIRDAAERTTELDVCRQDNGSGSHCTLLRNSDPVGAKVNICSGSGEGYTIPCDQARDMAVAVADKCSNGDIGAEKAGGWTEWSAQDADGWVGMPGWISISTP